MAPHGDSNFTLARTIPISKPPRLTLQRAFSDMSFDLTKDMIMEDHDSSLPPISEVEDAKCECCGMSEECTQEYIDRVRVKFAGRWVCGLCGEAVKGEVERSGGCVEGALVVHMSECAKFRRLRANPALNQAEAMSVILKKGIERAKSISPKGKGSCAPKRGGIARSSSCVAAITKDMSQIGIKN